MDKQKINLDQLYQERFQSFEMEQSSDISARMQKKLRFSKSIRLIKWITIGVVIVSSALIVALYNIDNEESETLIIKHKNDTETISNDLDFNNQIEQNSENNPVEEASRKEKSNLFGDENSSESIVTKKVENSAKNNSEINKEKALQVSEEIQSRISTLEIDEELSKQEDVLGYSIFRDNLSGELIKTPKVYIESEKEIISLNSTKRNVTPEKRLEASKAKFKSNNKTGLFSKPLFPENDTPSKLNAYFDLHFAPLMWQNTAELAKPDLDSTWSYSLNDKSQISYEFGFSFQLHHENLPFFLQSGLDYQVLKEKIDYQFNRSFEDPELSYWTYDSTWDYQDVLDTFYIIVDSNHFVVDSIFTIDTILSDIDSTYNPVTSTEEKLKKTINTYRYLNIPLLLGYQFQSKNRKWNYQILAGAAIAINLKNEGYYYTKTGDFETYSGKVNPSVVWSFYAAANINYRWKRWQLFAQPEFQYQLNESELSNQIPRRKYQFYKLKFGIRYQIF